MKYAVGHAIVKAGLKPFFKPFFKPSFNPFSGFTFPELLVAMSVAVILAALSAPFMNGMIVDNRVSNVTREVYSSLMLARSEAVKRQHTISLCSTNDGVSCDETNAGWHYGWLIFTDESQDGLINGNDQLLRKVGSQSDLVRIVWNRGFTVSFNSRGQTSTAGTFEICDSSVAEAYVKAVVISMTGRLRLEDRASCS